MSDENQHIVIVNCTEWKGINPETDPEYVFYYVANSTVLFVIVH